MTMRRAWIFGLLFLAGPVFAAPAEHGITGLRVIPLTETVNEVTNFTPDGRAAKIVRAYDNSAWLYLVMVKSRRGDSSGGEGWNVVPWRNREGRLVEPILDAPHTGEDYVRSIAFAHGRIDGEDATLLIESERNLAGIPIPDAAPVTYSVYRFENSTGAFAGDIEVFDLVRSWDAPRKFCNANLAMRAEFGFPVADYEAALPQPDGCLR